MWDFVANEFAVRTSALVVGVALAILIFIWAHRGNYRT